MRSPRPLESSPKGPPNRRRSTPQGGLPTIRSRKSHMTGLWSCEIFYIDKHYMGDGEKRVGIFRLSSNTYLTNLDYEKD